MADQTATQPKPALSSPFPAPPPFYKHFTTENLTQFRQFKKIHGGDPSSLPIELRYQIPPKPPSNDKYTSFGHVIDLNAPDPTLADAGIEQLFPNHASVKLNPRPHLIALARSLLTTFLALTGVLSQNPELFQEKTQDLQTIVFNMHDLINQYRPHQARESLILMTEDRIERLREEMREIASAREKMKSLVEGLRESQLDTMVVTSASAQADGENGSDLAMSKKEADSERSKSDQKDAWAALEALDNT